MHELGLATDCATKKSVSHIADLHAKEKRLLKMVRPLSVC